MSSSKPEKMGWTHASLLEDFRPNFKHIVLSRLDDLISLPYMDKKL
jgi:hypothetical protein